MLSAEQALQVVVDAIAREPPAVTPRRARLLLLPGKADAVIGTRRVGKTWLLLDLLRRLRAEGVPATRILYLNLEDDRLEGLQAADLRVLEEAFLRNDPSHPTADRWWLLDEVQVVAGWERFVRRLLDGGARVVITGSSARLLSREIATSMRGRAVTTELLPFSFAEALAHAGAPGPERFPVPAAERARLAHALDRYLVVGGYPEVQGLDAEQRTRVLRDYMDVALLRDVVERHRVSNVVALRALHRRLLGAPAGRFTVNRFHNDLKSLGVRVSKETLLEWVGHLEDACFAFFVGIQTDSEAVRRANPRKFYPADPALGPSTSGVGARLEVAVYLELRRRGYEVAYALDDEGRELDFVAEHADGTRLLVQACADLSSPDARAREVAATTAAMRRFPGVPALVVTLAERATIEVAEGTIEVRPAWEWFLG